MGRLIDNVKRQLLDKLAEEPTMVISTAYIYAKNYVTYGEDITKLWATAVQQQAILESARLLGWQDGYDSFKADYENRLKADMVAMLEDLRLDFQEAELAGVLDNRELIFADEVDDLVQQKINELPPVTPIRPKGYWKTRPLITFCSECGFELKIDNTNYCPNCGAKMDEPQESEDV